VQPVAATVQAALDAMQTRLFLRARARRDASIVHGPEAVRLLHAEEDKTDDDDVGASRMGHKVFFVPWTEDSAKEAQLHSATHRTHRCQPFDAPDHALFARAY
jgi:hypothetical protein